MHSNPHPFSTAAQLWEILTRDQRRGAIGLFGLSVIGMVLETVSIGLVVPALVLLTRNDLVTRYPRVAPLFEFLGRPSQEQLVIFGVLVLVGVYTIKAVMLGILAWRQMRFVFDAQADLSERLFALYLRQPYAFHLQRNSAQLIRNALNETNIFAQTVLLSCLAFVVEILVLFGILILMLAVELLGTLIVFSTLGFFAWAFNRMTIGRITRWGVERQMHEGFRIQHLQQGLGGAKDVKILGREEEFLRQFEGHSAGYARVAERQATLGQLPRLWLELLAVIGLAALVLILLWQGKPFEAWLPTLGLFAVGAFRILPSANRVINAIQAIRYGLPVIGLLHGELARLEVAPPPKRGPLLPFRKALTLEHITFSYPSAQRPALYDVSLRIAQGTSVGIVGSTGAGKSTLVDVMLGLLAPDSGAVLADGIDIRNQERGWQDQIGYVPQSIFLTDDTLRRNVAFGLAPDQIDEDAVRRAIRAAQLEGFVSELPAGLDAIVGERGVRLSGGQRQRIGIARALYHDPAVLVLDEATSSLDTSTESEIMDTVRSFRGNKTLIVVAHRLSTVQHCDRLFRLENGRVIQQGDTEEVVAAVMSGASDPFSTPEPESSSR